MVACSSPPQDNTKHPIPYPQSQPKRQTRFRTQSTSTPEQGSTNLRSRTYQATRSPLSLSNALQFSTPCVRIRNPQTTSRSTLLLQEKRFPFYQIRLSHSRLQHSWSLLLYCMTPVDLLHLLSHKILMLRAKLLQPLHCLTEWCMPLQHKTRFSSTTLSRLHLCVLLAIFILQRFQT